MSSYQSIKRQKSVAILATLDGLDEAALRQRWTDGYGQPPPARLSRALLLRAVAYHHQSKMLGGLSGHLRRRLATIANDAAANTANTANNRAAVPLIIRLTPGTQLVREWQGRVHRVQVTDHGFEYQNNTYRSLSYIARLITGTSWSGPAFFGLRQRSLAAETAHG